MIWEDLAGSLKIFIPKAQVITAVVIAYVVFFFALKILEKRLLSHSKSKEQISNVEFFVRMLHLVFFFIALLFVAFSIVGSWSGFGVTIGLLSAALGFALQRPITGIAAWMMLVVKRPFLIGDRIIIGKAKGDVLDISLSHVYLREIGGAYGGEERTGRRVMVPNYRLFEEDIINYSQQDDYVLGQVPLLITFESNLTKALQACMEIAQDHINGIHKRYPVPDNKRAAFNRLKIESNGVQILVRYFVPFSEMQDTETQVAQKIIERLSLFDDVVIAYPQLVIHKE